LCCFHAYMYYNPNCLSLQSFLLLPSLLPIVASISLGLLHLFLYNCPDFFLKVSARIYCSITV
jgi:hypothetical protein